MFPDPSTTRIVHDTMIEDELARRNPERRTLNGDTVNRFPGIRRGTARILIRLADRIAPAPLPEPEPTAA